MLRVAGLAVAMAIGASIVSGGNEVVVRVAFFGSLGLIIFMLVTGRARLRCPFCGKRVKIGYQVCHHCGRQVANPRPLIWGQKPTVANIRSSPVTAATQAPARAGGGATSPGSGAYPLKGGAWSEVVAESFYQPTLARTATIAVPRPPGERCFYATLVQEPHNPKDRHAVAVYSPFGQIGYVPRGSSWWTLLDELRRRGHPPVATCSAHLTGGRPGAPSYGVILHADPDQELQRLRRASQEHPGWDTRRGA